MDRAAAYRVLAEVENQVQAGYTSHQALDLAKDLLIEIEGLHHELAAIVSLTQRNTSVEQWRAICRGIGPDGVAANLMGCRSVLAAEQYEQMGMREIR